MSDKEIKMSKCPFNLPLYSGDHITLEGRSTGYPVIYADCVGDKCEWVIGHIRFETDPHSGTSRYMDYALAKEMADYACDAINSYDTNQQTIRQQQAVIDAVKDYLTACDNYYSLVSASSQEFKEYNAKRVVDSRKELNNLLSKLNGGE